MKVHTLVGPIHVLAAHCREHLDAFCCSPAFLEAGLKADDGFIALTMKLIDAVGVTSHGLLMWAIVVGAFNYGTWRALVRRSQTTRFSYSDAAGSMVPKNES